MRHGQTLLEYLLLFAVISAAMLGMQVYAKRGIQAVVKTVVDEMSPVPGDTSGKDAQALGMRQESGDRQKQISSGSVLEKRSVITTVTNQTRTAEEKEGGRHITNVTRDETVATGTSTSRVISKVKE